MDRLSLSLLSVLLASPAIAATPFVIERVDDGAGNDVGEYASLALDVAGNPHIAYYDATFADLYYASKIGGTWTIEAVDLGNLVGSHASMALDSQGIPHICYFNGETGNLRYASKSAGIWFIEVADFSPNATGYYTSVAIDAGDVPHVSFYDLSNLDLYYAHRTGGVWATEAIDTSGEDVGKWNALALDSDGNGHVVYEAEDTNVIFYATNSTGSWVRSVLDSTGMGDGLDLALDSNRHPHVAWATSNPRYATRTTSGWTLEVLPQLQSGLHMSIALDANGTPHLAHSIEPSGGALYYQVRTSEGWTHETIVSSLSSRGEYSSLALDAEGNPHVAYHDPLNGNLQYAHASVRVEEPMGSETWPVGAEREIVWSGAGTVDLRISTDGGATYQDLRTGIQDNRVRIRVPHIPTRFARVQVKRSAPFSTDESDSLFTIEASVSLLTLSAQPRPDLLGVDVTWQTSPGLNDLGGYRLERQDGETWVTLDPLVKAVSYHDPGGKPGTSYRLTAVNGFGDELQLGEVSAGVSRLLAAWPNPYRGGEMRIDFDPGADTGARSLVIVDIQGRVVRRLDATAATGRIPWNGADDTGRLVPTGLYFLNLRGTGVNESLKVMVIR